MEHSDILLSPTEAARKLGVRRRFVVERIHSGEIVAYRVGVFWRIPTLELHRYLVRNRSDRMSTAGAGEKLPEGGK